MQKAAHQHLHPLLKVCEWLLIMAVCTVLLFTVWYLLPIEHGDTGSLLLFQAMQAIGLFIVPAVAVSWLWSDEPEQWLHLTDRRATDANAWRLDGQLVLLSIGIIVTAIPLINCLVAWNRMIHLPESMAALEQILQSFEQQAEAMLIAFMTYKDGAWWVLIINLIVMAILPAIGEELTFRGVLQSLFRNKHVAVWVTAFVFSFVHFQFYGFVARMALGAVLGYALVWSGRIGYSMVMHATNNTLSVLLFYLGTYVWHLPQAELDAIGTEQTWWLTLVCTPLMGGMLYQYCKRCKSLQADSDHQNS